MRPGSIEAKILSEIRTAGGWSAVISNYGPSTGRTIDRLETKGWIETHGDGWRVLPAAPQTQEIVLASRTLSAWISQSGAVGRLENFKQHWEKVKNKNNY